MENATDLAASSYRCEMCALIRQALDQNVKLRTDDILSKSVLAPRPVTLYGIRASQDAESANTEASEPLMLIGVEVHVPIRYGDDDFDLVRLSLSAENGTSRVPFNACRPRYH